MTNTPDLKWIADSVLRQEDAMQQALDGARNEDQQQATDAPASPPPANAATEQQAFADLLAVLQHTDEGDTDTVVTILSADEFAADAFTPDTKDPHQ